MKFVLPALAIAALLCTPTAGAATRFALVVGHNLGDASETPLRWAEADAERVRRALSSLGNVQEDRAYLLLRPNSVKFREVWLELNGRMVESANRGEQPILFFYFSGHADAQALHFAGERFPLSELRRLLSGSAASVAVAILDACRNDRNPRVQNKGVLRAPGFAWPTEPSEVHRGLVVITSASEGEVAQESDDLQGSLFTHHLLSGIAGGADVDSDGAITLDELYQYGYQRTLEETHGRGLAVQHSAIDVRLAGRGNLVVSYPRRAESLVELGEDVIGSVLLVDDHSGRIAAEVNKPDARPMRVALPPARYRVQVRRGAEVFTGLLAVGAGTRRLSAAQLQRQPLYSVLEKGARFVPHPWLVQVGASASTPPLQHLRVPVGALLGVAFRAGEGWRYALESSYRAGSGEVAPWRTGQQELRLQGGVDRELVDGFTSLSIGVRAGTFLALQRRERIDAAQLEGLTSTGLRDSGWALAPLLGGTLAAELRPLDRIGLRAALTPSAWIWKVDGALRVGVGVEGSLAAVFWL